MEISVTDIKNTSGKPARYYVRDSKEAVKHLKRLTGSKSTQLTVYYQGNKFIILGGYEEQYLIRFITAKPARQYYMATSPLNGPKTQKQIANGVNATVPENYWIGFENVAKALKHYIDHEKMYPEMCWTTNGIF